MAPKPITVLDPEGDDIYYPVSGRPAHRSERQYGV